MTDLDQAVLTYAELLRQSAFLDRRNTVPSRQFRKQLDQARDEVVRLAKQEGNQQ